MIRRTKSSTLRTSATPSAAVGSSRTMRSELKCIARPIAMPCRSPPERLATVESTVMPTPRKPIDVEQDPSGDLLLALDVDEAEAVGDLPADEEIAPQRLLLGERLVLIDGLDREFVRHADRIVAEARSRVSRTKMRPAVGGSTPVITLISVDLPAPLSPIRPTISLRPIARVDVAQRVHGAEIFLHALQADDVTRASVLPPPPPRPHPENYADESGSARAHFRATKRAWQRDVMSSMAPQSKRNARLSAAAGADLAAEPPGSQEPTGAFSWSESGSFGTRFSTRSQAVGSLMHGNSEIRLTARGRQGFVAANRPPTAIPLPPPAAWSALRAIVAKFR